MKAVERFSLSGKILIISLLFALVMHIVSGWIVQKLKNDYDFAQKNLSEMQVLDENRYYHYLQLFGSMDIHYKNDKGLHLESADEELAFYRNSLDNWKASLEALVSDITDKMTKEEAGKFSTSQKLWSDSKEKLAQDASYSIKDSREKNIVYIQSQIESDRARAYELLKNYKHILENSFRDKK